MIPAVREEQAVAAFWEVGCLGVQVTSVARRPRQLILQAYFPGGTDRRSLGRRLDGALRGSGVAGSPVRLSTIPDRRWAEIWWRNLRPMRIGRRFLLVPHAIPSGRARHRILIRVRFGQAFGTGEHPTTRMCLRLLESYLQAGDRVVDIGTGTGVLAIAAHRVGAGSVLAIDHDPVALAVARDTVSDNRLIGQIELRRIDALRACRLGSFDMALVNIGAAVIARLLPSLVRALSPRGRVILAGLLVDDERELLDLGRGLGLSLTARLRSRPWSALLLMRPPHRGDSPRGGGARP